MTTDLDQWRKLSPRDFTTKLLNIAEEHVDILPEKAYVGLMNAAKVIHERVVVDDKPPVENDDDEVTSQSTIERIGETIIRLKNEKSLLLSKNEKYKGFKIMKRVTQKIKDEAIMHTAMTRYGVRLPCATFEALHYNCGLYIPAKLQQAFFSEYLNHRNDVMVRLRHEYDDVMHYIEDRINYFTKVYISLISPPVM
jgi:hypothetical protein